MKRTSVIICIIAAAGILHACKKNNNNQPTGTVYLDLPATDYQYYAYVSTPGGDSATINAPTAVLNAKATLGRVLFYDRHLSINNTISCGSCHKQANSFADNVAFSAGYENKLTKRNSMPVQNLQPRVDIFMENGVAVPAGFGGNSFILFWDGRENNLQSLVARPLSNHVEMGISDLSTLPGKLSALPYYTNLFNKAFGTSEITTDKISEAMTDYMMAINTTNSRFDKFNLGDHTQLNALEQQGYGLFLNKYNCGNCHHVQTDMYSTEDFMDTGLDPDYTDDGRGTITGMQADKGKFKVPDLHNVALTAPYMHDGRYKTLSEVIDHYSNGIVSSPNLDSRLRNASTQQPISMNITSQEKEALIAFLNSMTDYAPITDAKFSDPFKVK